MSSGGDEDGCNMTATSIQQQRARRMLVNDVFNSLLIPIYVNVAV